MIVRTRGGWLGLGFFELVLLLSVAAGAQQATPQAASPAQPANTAQELYLRLQSVGLDKSRVYRARDIAIERSSIHITLDDGTIGFTEDVAGHVTGAFFEGDGEVLLSPPNRVERASMALFTGAAILEERFVTAYFRFNDDTFAQLQPSLLPADNATEFLNQWNETARNLASPDGLRLLLTFSRFLPEPGKHSLSSSPAGDRMFHARLQGRKLGIFDLYFDSQAREQVWAGQGKLVNGISYYDLWCSFPVKAASAAGTVNSVTGEEGRSTDLNISRYTIDAEVRPPTELKADTVLDVEVRQGGERAMLFELSRSLQIEKVEADGQPIEFIHNPAIEGTQLARRGNDLLAIVFPHPLQAGARMRLRFVYGGDVLSEAGGGLLYVGARGTWYPNRGLAMADFDLTFHYPAGWTLVATGKRLSSENEVVASTAASPADQVSHWVSDRPIPVAGFNLGKYTRAVAHAGTALVETYAASGVERSFPRAPAQAVIADVPMPRGVQKPVIEVTPPPPSPARNAQSVADRSADAVNFFAQRFGPYPYSDLELTQMPGPLSQGWPGMIFLSSFSFLTANERAALHLDQVENTLSENVIAHETAHQWWGDLITWASYRDQWLAEALANYSALMMVEARDPAQFHAVLAKYRDDLLSKNKQGEILMDAGPVTLGGRLSSSHFPDAYDAISYGRGTWLFHMLRTMMRDAEARSGRPAANNPGQEEPFVRALRKLRDRYEGKAISTQDVLQVFAEQLPPSLWYEDRQSLEWFYDSWVNGTAVPSFQLRAVKYVEKSGSTVVTGTIVAKSAPKDLVTPVPLYAVFGTRAVLLGRVFADGPETSFRVTAPARTRKIVLDPYQTVLSGAR